MRLTLCLRGVNESHLVYRPVNVMKALSGQLFTRISKKGISPFSSNSMVNFMLLWRLLRFCKN